MLETLEGSERGKKARDGFGERHLGASNGLSRRVFADDEKRKKREALLPLEQPLTSDFSSFADLTLFLFFFFLSLLN